MLTPGDAMNILEIIEADLEEHGEQAPHKGGSWPPYRDADLNQTYLKVLAIAGLPINSRVEKQCRVDTSW